MNKYSIILPNEREKTYAYVTYFVLLINLLLSAFIYFNAVDDKLLQLSLWSFILCLFSAGMLLINKFSKRRYSFSTEIFFIILGVIWFLMDRYLLALCIICFAVIGFYARRKFVVDVSAAGIVYPTFPKKTYLWKEIENVVLKDGVLTIDLKNNKLIQVVIDPESSAAINEREFNLFCKSHLSA